MIQKILESQHSSSQSSSNTKLRDLIKSIRACKTQAEERALVQREKAAIRESFSNNEAEYRPRNVAKLLFINMLGHNTDFGQMECLNLITASSFTEKRIGYLGLTQLLHEQSEVLLMATHRIQNDLKSSSNYIISLALVALSEICTADMCRTIYPDVLSIMTKGTSFVKKKAALAATKIAKKLPDAIDQIVEKVDKLMEDRHHGVLLSTLGLVEELVYLEPKTKSSFRKYFTSMIRVMKGLVSTYSAEFDISGISDPFLQIQILIYFRLMAAGNKELSDEVSDTLANIASTTSPNKNTGNAVLYECVQTIFSIESTNSLKTLGINILAKFLTHKDANSKYCSLFMLKNVLNFDINAVAKHKQMIMDCLKENDISIKQLALDLTYLISDENNVKIVIKELLNFLLSQNDRDFLKELTLKICLIVDKHSPNKRWYVDTVVKVLTLAGNFVNEDSISLLIHLVCGTPDLQTYALHKLYFALQEHLNQEGLSKATLYILGEFGQNLVTGEVKGEDGNPIIVTEEDIVLLVERVFERVNQDQSIKEYGLTALLKLYSKFFTQSGKIIQLITKQTTSTDSEVQKRACEYLQILEPYWDDYRAAICETIPEYEGITNENLTQKPIGDVNLQQMSVEPEKQTVQENQIQEDGGAPDIDDLLGGGEMITTTNNNNNQNNNQNNDLDLMDLMGPPPQQQQNASNNSQNKNNNDLDILNLYGGNTQSSQQQQQQQQFGNNNNPFGNNQQTSNNNPMDDLFGDFGGSSSQSNSQQNNVHKITAFSDSNIEIQLSCTKNGNVTNIDTSFNNKTGNLASDIVFQVAVQKHLKLELNSINQSKIPPNSQGQTNQNMKITNTMQGEKSIAMKVKVGYTMNGQQLGDQVVIKDFPQGW